MTFSEKQNKTKQNRGDGEQISGYPGFWVGEDMAIWGVFWGHGTVLHPDCDGGYINVFKFRELFTRRAKFIV